MFYVCVHKTIDVRILILTETEITGVLHPCSSFSCFSLNQNSNKSQSGPSPTKWDAALVFPFSVSTTWMIFNSNKRQLSELQRCSHWHCKQSDNKPKEEREGRRNERKEGRKQFFFLEMPPGVYGVRLSVLCVSQ